MLGTLMIPGETHCPKRTIKWPDINSDPHKDDLRIINLRIEIENSDPDRSLSVNRLQSLSPCDFYS